MSFEQTLEFERETKNTYLFKAAGEDAAVTSLYVKKSAFAGDFGDSGGGRPQVPERITITVDWE